MRATWVINGGKSSKWLYLLKCFGLVVGKKPKQTEKAGDILISNFSAKQGKAVPTISYKNKTLVQLKQLLNTFFILMSFS